MSNTPFADLSVIVRFIGTLIQYSSKIERLRLERE